MRITEIIIAALADEGVRRALREALAVSPDDERIPLAHAAVELDVSVRVLRDAARRGELVIEGPRSARVVRRGELNRWLASHRVQPTSIAIDGDDRVAARRSVARAAQRFARVGS